MNEKLIQIIETSLSGDYVTAQELIESELDERKAHVEQQVTESVMHRALNESISATREIDGLGKLKLATDQSSLAVASMSDAVRKAPAFAAFVDGANKPASEYSAKVLDSETIQIRVGGRAEYDVFYKDGQLLFMGDFTTSEIKAFRETGRI